MRMCGSACLLVQRMKIFPLLQQLISMIFSCALCIQLFVLAKMFCFLVKLCINTIYLLQTVCVLICFRLRCFLLSCLWVFLCLCLVCGIWWIVSFRIIVCVEEDILSSKVFCVTCVFLTQLSLLSSNFVGNLSYVIIVPITHVSISVEHI